MSEERFRGRDWRAGLASSEPAQHTPATNIASRPLSPNQGTRENKPSSEADALDCCQHRAVNRGARHVTLTSPTAGVAYLQENAPPRTLP